MKKILLLFGFMLFIWQSNAQSYCTGGPSNVFDTNVDSVDLVGDTTTIAYIGCQAGGNGVTGVEDQTAQIADLTAGSTYTIDVQFGTCGGSFAWAAEVWIDYNLDFSFQASESIGTATGNGGGGPLSSFTFTVPTDAINGSSRLRVMQFEGGAIPLDPCQAFTYGSVTDFGITVAGGVDITCQIPFNVATANPTADAVDVTWDAEPNASNGYIWEVYSLGGDPAVDTPAASGTFPAGTTSGQATGLPSSSDLDLYLASDCGTDGISDLNGPFTFSTSCTVVGVPFTQDFSSLVLPNCWNQGANNGESWLFTDTPPAFGHIGDNGTVSSSTASGGGFAWVDDSAAHSLDTRLETPFIDVSSLNVPYLTFWLLSNNEGFTNVDFSVEVWDGAAWNTVYTSNSDTVDGEWQEIEVELSALTFTGDAQLAFVVDENNGTDFYDDVAIDDILLDEAPLCPKPSNVTLVDVFFDSLEVSWNPVSNATAGYIWEVYNQGDDPTVDTPVSTGTFPTGTSQGVADGLMPEMDYDFYLASDCGATDGQSIFALPISFTTTVLCNLPTTFDVSNLLPDSATLNWTSIPNAAGGYLWEVFNAGDDPTTATPVASGTAASTDNSVDVTGLTPNTQYEAYITTDCGADGQSVQSGALAFATPCTVFAAPFVENFDGASWVSGTGFGNAGDAIDACWNRSPAPGSYSWGTRTGATGSGGTGPSAANSGANYVYTESSNGAAGDEALLVTPLIDMSSLTDPALSFFYNLNGATIGTLSVDVDPGTGYDLDVFTISGNQGDVWVEQFVDLNAYLGQTVQIRFRGVRGTSFTGDLAIDDVRVDDAPTCLTPAPVTVSNITVDGADFSWADISGATNGYNWELYLAGADPAVDTPEQSGNAPAGTTTITVTSLIDGTDYDFYITSDCAASGTSLTVGPIAFQTLFLPPANDDACDAIPLTVGIIPPGDTYTTFAATAEPNEPVASCFNGGINGSVWFTFVAPASGDVEVSTDILGGTLTDSEVAVYDAPTDCTDLSTMGAELGCDQDGGVDVGFSSVVNLTGLTGGTTYYIQVDIWGTAAPGSFGISVIDTNPPCPAPVNVSFISSTTTTADLSWDDVVEETDGYNWFVFTAGDNPGSDTPLFNGSVGADITTVTITGLAPSTTYDFYVEANCGTTIGNSALSDVISFATQCTVFPTPFVEDFDGASWASGAGFANAGDAIDNCWSRNPGTGFFWGTRTGATGSGGTGPSAANSPANYVFTEGSAGAQGDEAFLDSPLLDLSNLNVPALFFEYHMNGGDMGTLAVDVITTTGIDLDVFTISGPQQTADTDPWIEQILDLSAYTGQTVQIRFRGVRGAGFATDMAIDDVKVDEAPNCLKPVNFTAVNVLQDSVEVSWGAVGNATNGYIWEVYNVGDDPTTATPVATGTFAAGTTQGIADGLNADTTYDIYIASDCGTDGQSDLEGPISFTTLCAVFTAPFTENFDGTTWVSGTGFANAGDAINNCWNRNPGSGFFWGTRTGATGSAGTGPSGPNSAANYMFTESSGGVQGSEAFLDSPLIDLSTLNQPALFFWYHMNGADMGSITVDVLTSTGVDLDIFTVSGPQQAADTDPWTEQIVDLSAYTGQTVQIRFRGVRGNGFTSDMAIDDMMIDEAPSCLKPVNLTAVEVFYDGLEISWGGVGNATVGYIWEVYNAGDDPATSTPVATGTFPAGTTQGVISDPSILPLTDYDVYIASDCGPVDGQSDLAGPVPFTTTELCSLPTTFTVDNVLPTQAELNWTSIPNATGYNWAIFNAGDNPTSATPVFSGTEPNTSNSVTVTGLIDNTAYDAYVTTDCGADGLSFLSPSVPFITPCLPFAAPFVENFDGSSWVPGTGFNNAGDAIDNCWSRDPETGFFWGTRTGDTGSGGTGPAGAFNGNNYVFTEGSGGANGSEAGLTTPFIDVSTVTVPALTFWYHMNGADIGSLNIDVNDGTGFVLDVFSIVGPQQTDETDDWIFTVVDLSAYAGQTIQVRFRGVRGNGFASDMAIDQVVVGETPTCFDPINLTTISVTDVTANLSWTPFSGETIFDVEVVPAGSTPTGIPTFEDVTLPFTADGLLPETDYDFYVRADCGAGDVSNWVGPSSFTTTFSPITVIVNAPPINQTYCYDNNEFKEWLFTSSDGVTPVEIVFNAGTIEDGTGSQDRLRVFDGFDVNAPVLYDSDVDGTDLTGVTLVATSGTAYMLLVSDIFGSCQGGVDVEAPFDFDVFAGNPLAGPMDPAPDPTEDPADVISMFSGVYTDVTVDTFLTPWSNGLLSDIQIQGNDTKFYSDLDFAGIETVSAPIDASGMDFFHIDVWSPNATTFRVKLVNDLGGANQVEGEIAFTIAQGSWESLQIPLTDFADPTLVTDPNNLLTGTDAIAQYIISGLPAGSLVIYADNIYFSKTSVGTEDFVFSNFTFYPSPAKENLYLESTLVIEQVKVFNMLGQEVIGVTPNTLTPTINVGALQTGTYIMNVTIDGATKNFRFIKE